MVHIYTTLFFIPALAFTTIDEMTCKNETGTRLYENIFKGKNLVWFDAEFMN